MFVKPAKERYELLYNWVINNHLTCCGRVDRQSPLLRIMRRISSFFSVCHQQIRPGFAAVGQRSIIIQHDCPIASLRIDQIQHAHRAFLIRNFLRFA